VEQKTLSVFGDTLFPKWGKGSSLVKRDRAVNSVVDFFSQIQPELVYIMPTKGTASVVPLICMAAKIPYILVSPYPGFYNGITKLDKMCVKRATEKAKSFIIIHDAEPDNAKHAQDILEESIEFMSNVSTALVFMYSKKTDKKYKAFIDKIWDEKNEKKILWELIYDGEFSR
jgi:hypothetical protein